LDGFAGEDGSSEVEICAQLLAQWANAKGFQPRRQETKAFHVEQGEKVPLERGKSLRELLQETNGVMPLKGGHEPSRFIGF
jgi:hypothetical protein